MMELEKLVHFDAISLSLPVIKPIQHLVLPKSFRFSFFFSSTTTLRFREGISAFYLLQVRTNVLFLALVMCTHYPPPTLHITTTHIHTHTHFLPIALRSPPLAQRCLFPPPPILHPNLTRHSEFNLFRFPTFNGSNQSL